MRPTAKVHLRRSLETALRSSTPVVPPVWLCPLLGNSKWSFLLLDAKVSREGAGPARNSFFRQTLSPWTATYHTRAVPKRSQRASRTQPRAPTNVVNAYDAPHALDLEDVAGSLQTLERLKDPLAITGRQTTDLVSKLHHLIRSSTLPEEEAKDMVNRFTKMYRQRHLPAHPRTTIALLCSFRDAKDLEGALHFWEWARQQILLEPGSRPLSRSNSTSSYPYTDLRTYGVALEILASAGVPLVQCEILFHEALQRFATDFNEYHMQPWAMLQDGRQATAIKGTSLTLLSGIMFARLKHDNWRMGYLALDTAIRLHPTLLQKALMIAVSRYRSIWEEIAVASVLIRGSNSLGPAYLSSLIGRLLALQADLPDVSSRLKVFALIMSFLRSCHHNDIRDMRPEMFHRILAKYLELLPSSHELTEDCLELLRAARHKIIRTIASMMNVNDRQILLWTCAKHAIDSKDYDFLQDLEFLDGDSVVTDPHQLLMSAISGTYEDLLHASRRCLNEILSASDTSLNTSERAVRAFREALVIYHFRTEPTLEAPSIEKSPTMQLLGDLLKEAGLEPAQQEIEMDAWNERRQRALNRRQRLEESQAIKFDNHAVSFEDRLATYLTEVVMTLDQPETGVDDCHYDGLAVSPWGALFPKTVVPNDWHRELFEKLAIPEGSTETPVNGQAHAQSPTHETPKSALSPNGIPYDVLRYRNWCSMNQLLLQAEAFERVCQTDKADQRVGKEAGNEQARKEANENEGEEEEEEGDRTRTGWRGHAAAMETVGELARDKAAWQQRILALRRAA